MIVAGPTGCGKTVFVRRLIEHKMFWPDNGQGLQRILWFSGTALPVDTVDKLQKQTNGKFEFHKGFDHDVAINGLDAKENNLIVLDDLMSEIKDSAHLADLFTKWSHHSNTSVVYLVQNLYEKGKSSVTAAKNAQYTVLFKNPRSVGDVRTLAQQLFPAGHANDFIQLVHHATQEPYTYLLIDCHPQTPDVFKFRTNIFPGEETTLFSLKGIKS